MKNQRPLSPHLSIHKKILTSIFSIFHRVTGIGLSIGSILICLWISLIAFGAKYYLVMEIISSTFLFQSVLFIWTIGIFYHLYNGIRYLFWSLGYGLKLEIVYKTSYLVVVLTIISTIVVWKVI